MLCASVSVNATGLGNQGPGGVAAEGEMIAVGMGYNPVPEKRSQWAGPHGRRPSFQARYVASTEGQEALAEPLRQQAGRVGMGNAQRWIAISDGGVGPEDLFRSHFGRIDEVVLDFFHASQYLGDFAKAWCPGDADAARQQHEDWAHRLKHEGGSAILQWLEGLDRAWRFTDSG